MLSHNLKSSVSLNVYNPWISSFYLQTCSVKRIGGSFTAAAYYFFIFCKTMTILGAATMRVRKSESTHQQSYGKRI